MEKFCYGRQWSETDVPLKLLIGNVQTESVRSVVEPSAPLPPAASVVEKQPVSFLATPSAPPAPERPVQKYMDMVLSSDKE